MSGQDGSRIDRRGLLKLIGAAGASAAVVSTGCSNPFQADVNAAGLTGGEWEKPIRLATAGPGGNKNWRPGDAVKFLPPAGHSDARHRRPTLVAACRKRSSCCIYERMNDSRKWETTMKDLFLAGKDGLYGAFHTYVGEEAIAVGVMGALNDDDYIASTHRGHGHLIAKGGDLNKMSAEIFFKETGYNKGYGGSMHITDMSKGIMGMNGIVGASYYMAAGAALRGDGPRHQAGRRRVLRRRRVRVAVLLQRRPQLREPEDAGHLRQREQLPVHGRADGADGADEVHLANTPRASTFPHHVVDGNDVTAVYAATKEAVEWARAGKGRA